MENSDVVIGQASTMTAAPYFIAYVALDGVQPVNVCTCCSRLWLWLSAALLHHTVFSRHGCCCRVAFL